MKHRRTKRLSSGRVLQAGTLALLWLGTPGCDADEPVSVKPGRDAQVDANADPDATAGDPDTGLDGSTEPQLDGSDVDAGDSGISQPNLTPCEVSEEDNAFATDVAFGDDGQFSLSVGSTGFGVAYQGGLGCDEIQTLPVQAAGAFATPTTVLADCLAIRELALLHVAQGWRVVWIDNSADSDELQSMLLTESMSGSVGALRTQLTRNVLREQRPVLANLGGEPVLAFIATDPVSGKTRISSQRLAESAEVRDVVREAANRKPVSLTLTQIGKDDAALAWVDEEGAPGIWLQRTDLVGAARGEPTLLSNLATAGSTVDLAARKLGEGGAVLYSIAIGGVNQEVRFRRLSEKAEPLGGELKIVGRPLQARDASFARLGGGYAVAYRALPGGAITAPEIRLTFITKQGDTMRDAQGNLVSYKLADAGSGGGRVTIRVSNDGQLLIGFVDATAEGKQLRLVRRRLDCAL